MTAEEKEHETERVRNSVRSSELKMEEDSTSETEGEDEPGESTTDLDDSYGSNIEGDELGPTKSHESPVTPTDRGEMLDMNTLVHNPNNPEVYEDEREGEGLEVIELNKEASDTDVDMAEGYEWQVNR